MSGRPPVQVVQLTPPGRGAIATLLIEGPGAVELLERQFHPNGGRPLQSRPADQLVVGRFGHFQSAGHRTGPAERAGEEVVVRRRSDGSIELHCHGGRAAVAMIQEALVEQGGRAVAWRDWLRGHHQDPITAAAQIALADARTERTAAILLDQYHGALRGALEEIEQALRNHDTLSAGRQIDTLWARAGIGRHLTRPWRVVLTGRANVGKSSLINALVGYPRAIVHRTPGTTRDVLTATTAVDGWPIELSDTAGLHESDEPHHQAAVERVRERLSRAELVILVFDASVPWSKADGELIDAWPDGLVVHNKSDLSPSHRWDKADGSPNGQGGRPKGLSTSALTGEGIESLGQAIADRLVPDPPPCGAPVPFAAGQVEHLAGCRLRAGSDCRAASRRAGERRR
ncbi:MAG: GTPase [Planctomycetota bacterium]|jgi:tRNA modification GTPase